MKLNDFQKKCHEYSMNCSVNGDAVSYNALGLAEEAGEIAGKCKKLYRDKNGIVDENFKKDLTKEMGDALWYLAEIATALGITLEEAAQSNIDKCEGRLARGTVHGEGDNR